MAATRLGLFSRRDDFSLATDPSQWEDRAMTWLQLMRLFNTKEKNQYKTEYTDVYPTGAD